MVSGVDPVVGMVVGVVFILELLEVAPPFTIITCTDYEGGSNFKDNCMPARRSFVVVYERKEAIT